MSVVTDILKQNGLEQYCEIFEQNKIDTAEVAKELTDSDYLGMGISILGDRKRLLSLFAKQEAAPEPQPQPQPGSYVNNQPFTQVVAIPTGTGPLVMGILGLFGSFIPIVKHIMWLLSLLAIFIGVSQRKKLVGANLPTGKATAGIVLGSIAVLKTVISLVTSVMLVGAVFSGVSSSKSSSPSPKRINFFSNDLPYLIQDTVWSNGYETIEFGRNKIKINDDWHKVTKVMDNNRSYGNVYTVYISGRSFNLEYTNRLRLAGYKTLDEIEAERKIANQIKGEWRGNIRWADGVKISDTPPYVENNIITAILTLNITVSGDVIVGRFSLISISTNQVRGTGTMNIEYTNSGEYNIRTNAVNGEVFNTNNYIKDYISITGKVNNNRLTGGGQICMGGVMNCDINLERISSD
jgi:hypothetical protein